MDDKLRTNIQNSPHTKIININFEEVSLRDFFAGCALMGIEANTEYDMTDAELAKHAYKGADAMLTEREKARDD